MDCRNGAVAEVGLCKHSKSTCKMDNFTVHIIFSIYYLLRLCRHLICIVKGAIHIFLGFKINYDQVWSKLAISYFDVMI